MITQEERHCQSHFLMHSSFQGEACEDGCLTGRTSQRRLQRVITTYEARTRFGMNHEL